jgi:hypothetical protein
VPFKEEGASGGLAQPLEIQLPNEAMINPHVEITAYFIAILSSI